MENENNKQDFYWESPCEKCRFKHDNNSSGWTNLLLVMFVVAFLGMLYFWGKSDSLEKKLDNSIYMTGSGDLHHVKNGDDQKIFDASGFYDSVNELFDGFGDGFEILD